MSPVPQILRRHPLISSLIAVILILALIFALWAAFTLNYTYSDGDRAGFLQKISRKGWICKTWEGEMQLSAIPGSAPETFYFTVRSDSVAQILNGMNGQRVSVHYEEHKGVPGRCFGDTDYFVDGARLVTTPPP